MKIALIRPPKIAGAFEKILIQEPINLAGLAAFLNQNGFKTEIWDFEVEPFSIDILRSKIIRSDISMIGMTSMTPTINNAHDIAKAAKSIFPDIITVAGGAHVSAIPEQTLREFPDFDYLILREGEMPLLELCTAIKENKEVKSISGIAFKNKSGYKVNPPDCYFDNLDKLPFPDRSLLNNNLYKNIYAAGIDMSGKRSTVVFTSRGCSQKCTFCAVGKTNGDVVRFRSSENVIKELEICKNKYGYNHITFEDTNFTLKKQRFKEICFGLKNLGLTWDCQTKVSFVDEQMIGLMKECGCLKIAYGVESGSQKILELMNKNITVDQVKKAFSLTHKAGIVACAFFILGSHPEETKDDIEMTHKLIKEIKPDVFQLGIICPYPGTRIYDIMQEYGMIKQINWKEFNFMHADIRWSTKHVSAEELVNYQKKIYKSYLLSPHFIIFFSDSLPVLRQKHVL